MTLIDNADQAKRLARAIISDVAIYNPEKVVEGIKNDNLFDVLQDQLAEGRQHFASRVVPELAASNIFELAIVDVLIKRSEKIESSIW
jgi:predicted NBD/HSP70 family sugar kinase